MNKHHGQAIIELVMALGVMSVILSFALGKLNESMIAQHGHLNKLRAEIFQPIPQLQWQHKPNDEFSQHVKPVADALNAVVQFDLPMNNVIQVHAENSPYKLARLSHGWQAESSVQLTQRPAQLTASYHLKNMGFNAVFDGIGHLPIAKELRNKSLVLGKVDAEITPFELRCLDASCQ